MISRYALLLSFVVALPAQAATTASIAVSYSDLSLASAEGRATLERRIERAVRTVCDSGDSRDLAMRVATLKCRDSARSVVQSKVQLAVERAQANSQLAGAGTTPGS